MYLILNNNNEIKGVGVTTDPTLKSVYVDETYYDYPFRNNSEAFICCYQVKVKDGIIESFRPYVPITVIEHIDQLGKQNEVNSTDIDTTMEGLTDTYELVGDNTSDIAICMDAITELYEMIGG